MAQYGRAADEPDLTFEIATDGAPSLRVVALRSSEALSDLFAYELDLISPEAAVDKQALLGQPCRLVLHDPDGPQPISGIVRAFARTGQGSNQTHYRVEMVPVHWYLTRRTQSRILQSHICSDMTVPGVIQHVLETAGIPGSHFRFALQEQYPTFESLVQYRETDFDFISRLMELEGIYTFFEHEDDQHVLVFADGPVAHVPSEQHAEITFRPSRGMVPDAGCIHALEERCAIESDAVTLDDFDFKNPGQQLRARQAGERFAALERVHYPGPYTDRSEGERYARVRLQAHQARTHVLQIETRIAGLVPGVTFQLNDHPDSNCNREYLVTAIEREAIQPQSGEEEAGSGTVTPYTSRLEVIPLDLPFRCLPETPLPRVSGSQTALVVGPPGEEIWPDQYGRVKVQFHWDQAGLYNEESSAWIRVSQGWAGGTYGMFFLPRVGQEVVVEFLEGDPNAPLITGSVYNKDNMPPVQLPEDKTISTIRTRSTVGGGGANELRFQDRKDEEMLFLHAQRDMHVRSLRDTVETIGGNRHLSLAGDQIEQVGKGIAREVALDTATQVGGNVSLEVGGDQIEVVQGNRSSEVQGGQLIKSSGTLVLESSSGITLKVGGNFLTIDPSGIYVMGTVVHVNGAGSALSGNSLTPVETTEPRVAETTTPGTDVTYQPDPESPGQIALTVASTSDEDATATSEETSWIEIELVDALGLPVSGEAYEITSPSGKTYTGSLDSNGQARQALDAPGLCQVSFPRLDHRTWARSSGQEAAT